MKKPFYYGKEVKGEYFTNRAKEIQEILSLLRSRPAFNIALVGSRRIGKTSLILELKEKMDKEIPILIKCEEELYPKTPENFFKNVVKKLAEEHEKRSEKLLVKLKRLKRVLPAKVALSYKEIGFFMEWKEKDAKALMEKTFDIIEKMDKETKTKVIIFLDEFQELFDFGDDFLWALRGYISDSPASFVVTSSLGRFEEELKSEKRPFFNFFTVKRIGRISNTELKNFIISRAKRFEMTFTNDAVDALISDAEGHPYYAQLLALESYECAKIHHLKRVDISVYKEAFERALEHIPAHLTSQFMKLRGKTRDLFIALCLGKSKVAEIAKEVGINTSNASQILKQIEREYDLIEKVAMGRYRLKDKFLATWVQNRYAK